MSTARYSRASVDLELVADHRAVLLESPTWDAERQLLYTIDIETRRLFTYAPRRGRHETFQLDRTPGALVLAPGGGVLVLATNGAVLRWRDGRCDLVSGPRPGLFGTRFNDATVDPAGRILAGVIRYDGSSQVRRAAAKAMWNVRRRSGVESPLGLYRLDDSGSSVVVDDVGLANGSAFNPDGTRFYFTDSSTGRILSFVVQEGCVLTDPTVFSQVEPNDGVPDGLTVDEAGGVWSAWLGGGCVVRYGPGGRVDRRLDLPASRVTSLTFGGPDHTDLYITTAGSPWRTPKDPLGGALFVARPGVRGLLAPVAEGWRRSVDRR